MGRLIWLFQILCLCFMLLHFQVECSSLSHQSSPNPPHLCLPEEHFVLLDFKSTIHNDCASDANPALRTWDGDGNKDCCFWGGITCEKIKGHVIGIDVSESCIAVNLTTNSSLFRLEKLQSLNLAGNRIDYPSISFGFHRWKSLTYLNLTGTELILRSLLFEISLLPKLVTLDLSQNPLLHLDDPLFQMMLHNLTELRDLFLEGVNMSRVVPASLLNLTSSLEKLDLSGCSLQGDLPSQVFQLPSLQFLDLTGNSYLRVNLPKSNWSSPLKYLSFGGCQCFGPIPTSLSNLTEIAFLSFSSNQYLDGQIPDVFGKMHKLSVLDFGGNNFSGELPASIFNLTQLTFLDLSVNQLIGPLPNNVSGLSYLRELHMNKNLFKGQVPSWLFTLPSLVFLDLFHNRLTGPIDHIQNPSLILDVVYLSNNEISGSIPSSFFDLVSLSSVDLSSNNLSGTITPNMLSKLVDLEDLDLSNNSFLSLSNNVTGVNLTFPSIMYLFFSSCNIHKFPSFLLKARNLEVLDISKNKISGQIQEWEIRGMSVSVLNLSYNLLTGIELFAFEYLGTIDLSSNLLQGSLPLPAESDIIQSLIISRNNLTGQIPSSICNLTSIMFLDLSRNSLEGTIPECLGNFSYLWGLDLRMNNFYGRIPNSFVSSCPLRNLNLNGNKLEGILPPSLGNCNSLEVIDVGNNYLNDTFPIPERLGNFSFLNVLNLRMNNFYGRIPNSFVSSCRLRTLNLNGNKLEGILPPSLGNCSSLEVIDVGNNYFNDTFPHWLGVLPQLKVLILRSNRFHGSISNPKAVASSFSQLRIIDISQNEFEGLLPTKYFQNFENMKDAGQDDVDFRDIGVDFSIGGVFYVDDFSYKDSVMVIMKGFEVELVRILRIFKTIDFSINRFHGEIPEGLGELNSLILLNLSHNRLTGQIPSSLGKMKELESLDLSSNKLEGTIPEHLTNMTFLSVLNLSHNKLVGHIPQGKQFDTFSNDSYIGNSGLCGLPLTKKCNNSEPPEAPPSKFEDKSAPIFSWEFVLAGYGCGLVLGLSLGYIIFTTGKPWRVVKKVEKYQQKFVGWCNRRHKKRKTQKPNQRS